MASSPHTAPEQYAHLQKMPVDVVARLTGAKVIRKGKDYYLAEQAELDLYRSNPNLEQELFAWPL
jgi:YHS domain-containing protein